MALSWSDSEIPLSEFLKRFKLPQIVQIAEGIYGEDDERTLSQGQELNLHLLVDQTVIATNRAMGDIDYQGAKEREDILDKFENILTFPSNLDVTVIAPEQADGADLAEYRRLCESLNKELDLEKIKERFEKSEEIYEEVDYDSCVTIIPYAELTFGSRTQRPKNNNHEDEQRTGTSEVILAKPIHSARPRDNTGNARSQKSYSSSPAKDSEYDSDYYTKVDEDSSDSSDLYEEPGEPRLSRSVPERIDRVKEEIELRKQKSTSSAISPADGKKEKVPLFNRFTKMVIKKESNNTREILPTSSLAVTSSYEHKEEEILDTGQEHNYDIGDGDFYKCADLKPMSSSSKLETHYFEKKRFLVLANKKVAQLTIEEVGVLLHDLKLGQYGEVFKTEQVDGKFLMDLDKDVLLDHFKMTPFHAHKLIKAVVENWRPSVGE